jgi:hypothetical protein
LARYCLPRGGRAQELLRGACAHRMCPEVADPTFVAGSTESHGIGCPGRTRADREGVLHHPHPLPPRRVRRRRARGGPIRHRHSSGHPPGSTSTRPMTAPASSPWSRSARRRGCRRSTPTIPAALSTPSHPSRMRIPTRSGNSSPSGACASTPSASASSARQPRPSPSTSTARNNRRSDSDQAEDPSRDRDHHRETVQRDPRQLDLHG